MIVAAGYWRGPEGMTRYVAHGGAAIALSENMAWCFGGLRGPRWGEVFQRNANLTENAVNAGETTACPGEVHGRANPEAVWLPVGDRGVLVGECSPECQSPLAEACACDGDGDLRAEGGRHEFMRTIDVCDVANGTWYRQITSGGPAARTRACAVVAPDQDLSSINIYLYGGYLSVDPTVEMNDEVWVLSLPSSTWTRIALPERRGGRYAGSGSILCTIRKSEPGFRELFSQMR
ncbi:hypothetical protein ACHAQA_010168 [Verticillium albo-atrum]